MSIINPFGLLVGFVTLTITLDGYVMLQMGEEQPLYGGRYEGALRGGIPNGSILAQGEPQLLPRDAARSETLLQRLGTFPPS